MSLPGTTPPEDATHEQPPIRLPRIDWSPAAIALGALITLGLLATAIPADVIDARHPADSHLSVELSVYAVGAVVSTLMLAIAYARRRRAQAEHRAVVEGLGALAREIEQVSAKVDTADWTAWAANLVERGATTGVVDIHRPRNPA